MNTDKQLLWRCGKGPLSFHCFKKWDELEVTEASDIRHCNECQRNVHLCTTPERFVELAARQECVAIPSVLLAPDQDKLRKKTLEQKRKRLGLGMPPVWYKELEADAMSWWKAVMVQAPSRAKMLINYEETLIHQRE